MKTTNILWKEWGCFSKTSCIEFLKTESLDLNPSGFRPKLTFFFHSSWETFTVFEITAWVLILLDSNALIP